MSKKRSREQKIISSLKKQLVQTGQPQQAKPGADFRVEFRKPDAYRQTLNLAFSDIKRDLAKTIVFLIVAVGAQLAIRQYLDHGGWAVVHRLLGA